jgi:hypothetical protein
MRYWQPLEKKIIVTRTLPLPENEQKWRTNNNWYRIMTNLTVSLRQYFIYNVLAAFSSKIVLNIRITPLQK